MAKSFYGTNRNEIWIILAIRWVSTIWHMSVADGESAGRSFTLGGDDSCTVERMTKDKIRGYAAGQRGRKGSVRPGESWPSICHL